MCRFAHEKGMTCSLSVGPGYNDEKIRPWNRATSRSRENGAYMDRMFQHAIDAQTDFISITSYNEWGEGTQIEPAVDPRELFSDSVLVYEDPSPPLLDIADNFNQFPRYLFYKNGSSMYLNITQRWVEVFKQSKASESEIIFSNKDEL